jgi:hypothetical protein
MGNCVHSVSKETQLPNGEKLIRGTFIMSDSYATGGDGLNLANYLKTAGSPTVVVSSANGYCFQHDTGTASAGKIKAYYSGVNGLNVLEVLSARNLVTVNVPFFAIGPAF